MKLGEILDKLTELRTKVKEKRICDVNFSKLDVEVLPAKSILANDLANFLKAIDDKYDRIYVTKKTFMINIRISIRIYIIVEGVIY